MFVFKNSELIEDDFLHEQYLIIQERDKVILISGCSHKGIINIINECINTYNLKIDYVIGGFIYIAILNQLAKILVLLKSMLQNYLKMILFITHVIVLEIKHFKF